MSKFVKINKNFSWDTNFWELNPQVAFIYPFSVLYNWDDGQDKSSQHMWSVFFMVDPDEEEQPLTRRRNVVRYDDGLTEDQFLRALEDEEDLTEVAERKRERAEKRRLKQLGQDDEAKARSASPTGQNTGERKRKLEGGDADQTASQVDSGFGSTSDDTTKRRKMDSDAGRLKEAMLKCYFAVEQCEEPETGRLRSVLFMDIPKKNEYPDTMC